MKITSAEFFKSVAGTDPVMYDGKFQIAFVGRSNVGKSSLINMLCRRKNLAKSSTHPGKTKRLDFFLINNSFYFVDLPGYGFAETNAKKQEDFRKRMLWYLMYSDIEAPLAVRSGNQKFNLRGAEIPETPRSGVSGIKYRLVVLIIDAKVGLTKFDREMFDLLTVHKIDFIIAANKIDKLKMSEKEKQLKSIRAQFPGINIFPLSTVTKRGKAELENHLLSIAIT